MGISIVTKEDLQEFKIELLEAIEHLLKDKKSEQKLWLRTAEVKKLLNISSGTLQNLRIKGTLTYSRIGGTLYYSYKDIQKLLTDVKK
ncbi:helix-turn-helix domain-containing protein [Weeksellaceae bacterium A-14]